MNVAGPLAGLRVLVTRPAAQAAGIQDRLLAAGAEPQLLPLLRIVPSADPEAAAQQLREARGAAFWLFTSANAVQAAARLGPERWPPTLIAIGGGTAAALAKLGYTALAPEGADSETLLAWPRLQAVEGQELLIVTGEGGRGLLAQTLAERGARVRVARCYRREPVAHAPEAVAAALAAVDIALLTSGEALERLLALTPDAARARLLALPLVVPSARVVELARRLGFRAALLVPDAVSDAAYLACLLRWRQESTL
jgi:uroporphyrinogen-III synthase